MKGSKKIVKKRERNGKMFQKRKNGKEDKKGKGEGHGDVRKGEERMSRTRSKKGKQKEG